MSLAPWQLSHRHEYSLLNTDARIGSNGLRHLLENGVLTSLFKPRRQPILKRIFKVVVFFCEHACNEYAYNNIITNAGRGFHGMIIKLAVP